MLLLTGLGGLRGTTKAAAVATTRDTSRGTEKDVRSRAAFLIAGGKLSITGGRLCLTYPHIKCQHDKGEVRLEGVTFKVEEDCDMLSPSTERSAALNGPKVQ